MKIYKKYAVVLGMVFLCLMLAGCGCGKKSSDPASQQVLKITITPESSPTPEPAEDNSAAVVTNGNITMVNTYLEDNPDSSTAQNSSTDGQTDGSSDNSDTDGDTQGESSEEE